MSAAINRSLTSIKNELEFLRDSNVITSALYTDIVSKLPQKYIEGDAPRDAIGAVASKARPTSSTTNETWVEALYDYDAEQAGDLGLKTGDKVKVLEKLSSDWWKGQKGSDVGVFPSNYVKVLDDGIEDAKGPANPPPSYQNAQVPQSTGNSYQQQPTQQYYQQQPPQQYYQQQAVAQQQQQQQPYYQQQMMPQEAQQVQQPAKQHGKLGKFGSQLGQAAIFGAGATIGSDLVNAIF